MLGAPEIIGKLSECSLGVQFHKLLPGATVRLQTESRLIIDEWPVSNADQAFEFRPGKKVIAGMDVQAIQLRAGDTGLLSNVVHVGGKPTPADLSVGEFAKPLYECGECIWLFNLFPGAKVSVLSNGSELLGESIVRPSGEAHVDLNRPLKIGDETITAIQAACGAIGSPVTSATPIKGGRPVPLDGLTFPQTQLARVKACSSALYFEKVMAGAYVILTRTPVGGLQTGYGPICLSVAPFTLLNYAPFQGGEELVIETRLEKCNKAVGSIVRLTVDSSAPNAPNILKDICTDAMEILLSGLEINAMVEITFTAPDGSTVTLVFGASAPQDSFPLSPGQPGAPKLVPGMKVGVRQNLCGGPTSWSNFNTKPVFAAAPKVPTPTLPNNGSTAMSLTPILSWLDAGKAPCSQATKFDIRVATTAVMAPSDIVFAPANGVLNTSVAVPAALLQPGTTYYWQVRAYHAAGSPSAWSVFFQFTTQHKPAPPPQEDQEFFFCQICPGFDRGKTISVTAPDYATAEANAQRNVPSTCFLNPGRCPDPGPR
jgi:hypothetical protein